MDNDVQTTGRPLGVILGYDGSHQSTRALHWAARAAQRKGLPLTVITAYTVPAAISGYTDPTTDLTGTSLAKQGAEDIIAEARRYLVDYPGEVTYRIEYGDAAGVLIGLSAQASLVVVGSRGRGGFLGMMLGSVASSVPAHTEAPAVVVPASYDPETSSGQTLFSPVEDHRPVTVGVDGSAHGRTAALEAAEEAAARGTSLRVVLAMPPLDAALVWYPELAPRDPEFTRRHRQHLEKKLKDECAWLQEHFPQLQIDGEVAEGTAAEVLTAEAPRAQLTVLGTRGRGGIASTLLGSVSRAVLLKADGPVMVVPERDDPRLQTSGSSL